MNLNSTPNLQTFETKAGGFRARLPECRLREQFRVLEELRACGLEGAGQVRV